MTRVDELEYPVAIAAWNMQAPVVELSVRRRPDPEHSLVWSHVATGGAGLEAGWYLLRVRQHGTVDGAAGGSWWGDGYLTPVDPAVPETAEPGSLRWGRRFGRSIPVELTEQVDEARRLRAEQLAEQRRIEGAP